MSSNLLKPLDVFCSQSQCQQYIKTVRNLGNAWHTLKEEPDADPNTTIIGTTFDLTLKTKNGYDKQKLAVSLESSPSAETTQEITELSSTPPRHFRIFADYRTDFIWLDVTDPQYTPSGGAYVEASDALAALPPSVFEKYEAWENTYTTISTKRLELHLGHFGLGLRSQMTG